MSKAAIVIQAEGVCKSYTEAGRSVSILDHLSLVVEQGESLAIIGSSGSGKSTLLNVLGGLDSFNQGRILLSEQDLSTLNEREQCRLRNQKLGFVYQFHHLLPEFSALENVAMPLLIGGEKSSRAMASAKILLNRVGLSERLQHRPSQLSGGERQRVAIARALANQPACVLMDEPTGNLDQKAATAVFDLIQDLNQQSGTSFIIVTHDMSLARRLGRCLELNNGQLDSRT